MTITDERVLAYVDGELSGADLAAMEAAIAADTELAGRIARERQLRERIAGHYAPVLDDAVPDRFRALLTPDAEVVDFAAVREERQRRFRLSGWGGGAALAASLAVGLVAGQLLSPGGGVVVERGGALVASGKLDRALGMQLASLQEANAPVRIGLTFRDKGGDWCRSFEADALSGIACREGGAWTLRYAASGGGQQTEYRQAGSGELVRAAQAMMAGAPLDAEAEKRVRDAGWE
jgi:anti-sigma factor RsiW